VAAGAAIAGTRMLSDVLERAQVKRDQSLPQDGLTDLQTATDQPLRTAATRRVARVRSAPIALRCFEKVVHNQPGSRPGRKD
jgi:hypothetical protein